MNKEQHIPNGYKISELGVIPEDWEVKRLGDLCEKIGSGVTPRGGEAVYKTNGHYFIRSQNVGWDCLLLNDVAYIDENTHQKQISTELRLNDVLLNITGASIGRCAIVSKDIVGGNVNQHVCIIRPKNIINSKFLSSSLLSHNGQKYIDSYQSGGNREGLNFEQIKSFKFAFPPINEQERIAEVLSTWDKAIEKQSKMIDLLERRKRALMQRLLTGKTRVPGFSEPWMNLCFEDIYIVLNVKKYQIQKSEYKEAGKYPIVDQGQGLIIAFSDEERCFTNTPVIIFGDHTRIIKWVNFDFIVGADGIQCFHTKSNINTKFGYYLLNNVNLPNLGYSRHMRELKHKWFKIPSIDEQKAIVEILDTSDVNIDISKKKLKSYVANKQALMQQLLTGKKRLKI